MTLKLNTLKQVDDALTKYWKQAARVSFDGSAKQDIYDQLGRAEDMLRELGDKLTVTLSEKEA